MSAGRGAAGPGGARRGRGADSGRGRSCAARSYVITALGGTTPGEKEQMEEDYKKQIAELQEKLDKALEDVKKLEKTDEPAEGEAAEGGEGEAEPAAE